MGFETRGSGATNDRDWFAANEHCYGSHVREPTLELIRRLSPPEQQGLFQSLTGAATAVA